MLFLILMVVGLAGLVMMALPALGQGGHPGTGHGGDIGHAAGQLGSGHAAHGALGPSHGAHGAAHQGATGAGDGSASASVSALRFLPSPRTVFSFLAIYGAFANAMVRAGHLSPLVAGVAAIVPTLLLERFAVTPLWNLMFRFQGKPSSPLHELMMCEARAVTPFKNGRGLVSVERDGRVVQFMAQLTPAHVHLPIRVGEVLRIEEVDAQRERLLVSLPVKRDESV